jgi:hypothetical protein
LYTNPAYEDAASVAATSIPSTDTLSAAAPRSLMLGSLYVNPASEDVFLMDGCKRGHCLQPNLGSGLGMTAPPASSLRPALGLNVSDKAPL